MSGSVRVKSRRAGWALVQATAGVLMAGGFTGCAQRPEPLSYPVFAARMASGVEGSDQPVALRRLWPADFRAVQRVLLTVGWRDYAADGLFSATESAGARLALVSPLGLVTEVACSSAGEGSVVRTTPLMPESWARDFVVRDLVRVFKPVDPVQFQGVDSAGRSVWVGTRGGEQVRYVVDDPLERVEAIEVLDKGKVVYQARFSEWQAFRPLKRPLPTLIEVDAGAYRLWIRMVQLQLGDGSGVRPAGEGAGSR